MGEGFSLAYSGLCSAKPISQAFMAAQPQSGSLGHPKNMLCGAAAKGPSVAALCAKLGILSAGAALCAPDQWPRHMLAKRRCQLAVAELAAESAFLCQPLVRIVRPAAPHPTQRRYARQYAARPFFRTQARPFDVIAHASFQPNAHASIAAGTGATDAALLHGSQCELIGQVSHCAVGSMRAMKKGAVWVMVVGAEASVVGGRVSGGNDQIGSRAPPHQQQVVGGGMAALAQTGGRPLCLPGDVFQRAQAPLAVSARIGAAPDCLGRVRTSCSR